MKPVYFPCFLISISFLAKGCVGEIDDPDRFIAARDGDPMASGDDVGGPTPPDAGGIDMGVPDDTGVEPIEPQPIAVCELYQDVQAELVIPTCGSAGCHDGVSQAGTLDLASPGVEARLVGVTSQSPSCSGTMYVDSSSLAESLLYTISTGRPPCSLAMPLTMPAGLNEEDGQCLLAWMEELVQLSQ